MKLCWNNLNRLRISNAHVQTNRLPGVGVVTKPDTDGDYTYSYGELLIKEGFCEEHLSFSSG
jgi:hypothetical protein